VLRGCDVTCTTSEDCAEWQRARRARQTMSAWAFRRCGSVGMGGWYRLFTTPGDAVVSDDAWCPHESNDGVAPCVACACVRVDSVCGGAHSSPRRCLTGDDGA
jgi:hypothetical protein